MTAMSSMRLLVVAASAPEISLRSLARDQQRRPPAGTGIAAACPVGIDLDLRHGPTLLVGSDAGTRTRCRALRLGRTRVSVCTRLRALSRYPPAVRAARGR